MTYPIEHAARDRSGRLSPAEVLELLQPKRSKYGVDWSEAGKLARTHNGILYDSRAECEFAAALDVRVKVGEIKAWWRQIKFPLIVNDVLVCNFLPDFKLLHVDNSTEIVEVKGSPTSAYKLKLKLFRAIYPKVRITVVKAKRGGIAK